MHDLSKILNGVLSYYIMKKALKYNSFKEHAKLVLLLNVTCDFLQYYVSNTMLSTFYELYSCNCIQLIKTIGNTF